MEWCCCDFREGDWVEVVDFEGGELRSVGVGVA